MRSGCRSSCELRPRLPRDDRDDHQYGRYICPFGLHHTGDLQRELEGILTNGEPAFRRCTDDMDVYTSRSEHVQLKRLGPYPRAGGSSNLGRRDSAAPRTVYSYMNRLLLAFRWPHRGDRPSLRSRDAHPAHGCILSSGSDWQNRTTVPAPCSQCVRSSLTNNASRPSIRSHRRIRS